MNRGAGSSEQLKRAEAASFDGVAPDFARLSEEITGPLAQRFVDGAGLQPGDRILDLGTGTGIVARRAAAAAGEGTVVAIDLARAMLHEAQEIERGRRLGVLFTVADAERLCFRSGAFDRALSLFTMSHLPEPSAAAAELFRIVRAGGTVAVGVGSGPARWSRASFGRAVRTLPELLAWVTGKRLVAPDFLLSQLPRRARASGPPATRAGGAPAEVWLPQLLRAAGFAETNASWERGVAELADAASFWRVHATFSTPIRNWLAAASRAEIARVRRDFDRRCRRVLTAGGKLVYPFAALVVRARRP